MEETPDLVKMLIEELGNIWREYLTALAFALPRALGMLLVLLIGWLLGRFLGKLVATIVRVSKVDEALKETPVGQYLSKAGYTLSSLLDLATRATVYLFSAALAVRALRIPEAIPVAQELFTLVSRIATAIIILVIGIVAVEKMMNIAYKILPEDSGHARAALGFTHAILLFLVLIAALTGAGVDLSPLATLVVAVAWGAGAGLGFSLAVISLATFQKEIRELMISLAEGLRPSSSHEKAGS